MNHTHLFVTAGPSRLGRATRGALAGAVLAMSAQADMFQPKVTPGGIDPHPTITSLVLQGTNTTLSWYGLEGSYNILATPSLAAPRWTSVASALASTYPNSLSLTTLPGGQNFFRLNLINNYVGSGVCGSCHGDTHATWQQTAHASAYNALIGLPPSQVTNQLVYRTVGYGQPTGFVDVTNTPYLTGVGCENCHGPGGAHVYGNHSLVQPAVTIAAELCGGCHDGSHYPFYTEWTNSAHAAVTPTVAAELSDTPGGQRNMMGCGSCHSGAVRDAMLDNYADTQAGYIAASDPIELPSAADATHYAQTCAVCHDPHSTNGGPFQLRNPIASTNFFSYSTAQAGATNQVGLLVNLNFNSQYTTNIQVCAQCHNLRGALWTDTSRPPHESLQYNMLLGNVGVLGTNVAPYQPSTHARFFTNQCVDCHMQSQPYQSAANPAITGHRFSVDAFDICTQCHGPQGTNLVIFAENMFLPAQTQQGVAALNLWAATKAPTNLYAKYGNRAWEYTTPGALSPGGPGPNATEQAQIPDNIKKARFDLYLANNDPASGIHNPLFVIALIDAAVSWVQLELDQ